MHVKLVSVLCLHLLFLPSSNLAAAAHPAVLPIVINTWSGPFTAATESAFSALDNGASALDAVQRGCSTCEREQCDGTVGPGGSPDEACETTLDAMLMDGRTLDVGAVAGLRRIRDAVAVARLVLDRTDHSMLAGDLATAFAVQHGFVEEDLDSPESRSQCSAWRRNRCRPNFRRGPAQPFCPQPSVLAAPLPERGAAAAAAAAEQSVSHDTISMIALDATGALAAGTSTNGAAHKVPGRVGDGPIPGSGSYADGSAGGCGATGDGDVLMRLLPCYQAVENLRLGMEPGKAAEDAVRRVLRRYPAARSGIVVLDRFGRHGAAASGWNFTYSFRAAGMSAAEVVAVLPLFAEDSHVKLRTQS